MHLAEGSPGFDFLGFHHRLVRGRTPKSAHLTFLARWPSRKAAQHARDRIREITGRERLLVPAEVIVTELNMFLRGWAGYFRYGNSARVLGQVGNYALWRLGLWLSKKGNRRHGWRMGRQPRCCYPRTTWAWPASIEPSSRPGPSGTGAGRPNTAGEERR